MLKILDRYILKRFIGTFFFSISLMLCVFIVFDISEKLSNFISEKIPIKEIIFDSNLKIHINITKFTQDQINEYFMNSINIIRLKPKLMNNFINESVNYDKTKYHKENLI